MIVRRWCGIASVANAEAYPGHLRDVVQPALAQLTGFQGVYLLARQVEDEVEYIVLTLWDSMDAIRQFAGEESDRAVVEPEAQAVLLRFDAQVTHHHVLVSPEAMLGDAP
jgi:heme-degrading monooxygenase HmoA